MIITVLKNRGSRSARTLARLLRFALPTRVTEGTVDSIKRCRGDRLVINWGVATTPTNWRQRTLVWTNTSVAVDKCRDKLRTFTALQRHNVPAIQTAYYLHEADLNRPQQYVQMTGDDLVIEAAYDWLDQDGKIVVRHTTTGHSGAGIQVVRRGQDIPDAPLYTRYFRKDAEYRVHVAFNEVILIQQKRKRNGIEHEDEQHLIRTHANGWVFTANDLSCNQRRYTGDLCALAIAAANAVGCAHCAVDILVRHNDNNDMVVCEINSAPGLEAESTQLAYRNAFVKHIEETYL